MLVLKFWIVSRIREVLLMFFKIEYSDNVITYQIYLDDEKKVIGE
jgi:hypothetical protein